MHDTRIYRNINVIRQCTCDWCGSDIEVRYITYILGDIEAEIETTKDGYICRDCLAELEADTDNEQE